MFDLQMLHRLAHDRRGRVLGVAAGCAVVVAVLVADVVEGPGVAYLGVLTAAPLLAAVFAWPRDVFAVGVLALAAAQTYAQLDGGGTGAVEVVRLLFIGAATLLAVVAAALRQVRERELRELTDIAEVAQATILQPLPRVAGSLSLAGRYRSAASAARIGGDFYDVANTPHGVRILLGDVRGKGLDAVRLAAAVLGSFREAAYTMGPDIAVVARAVSDATARHVELEDFVTAVFVEFDVYGRGRMVRCGHPAPLRIAPDGVAAVESTLEQPPLGLLTDPRAEPLTLAARERLLLYTDGLTEARDPDGAFLDVDRAGQLLAGGSLDEALDRLLAAVTRHTGGHLRDDLALLLVEHHVVQAPAGGGDLGTSRPAQGGHES